MLIARLARHLAVLLIVGAGVFGVHRPAGAALFLGSFDPAFGASIPSLGFRGQGQFFIPDACVALGTGVFDTSNAACAGMNVTSAYVEYYNTTTVGQPTLLTQFYVPPSQPIFEIVLAAGNLIGVDTIEIGPQFINVPSIYSGNSWLLFEDGILSESSSPPGAFVFACAYPASPSCDFNDSTQSARANITFTRVPEPGTLALVTSALVIGGLSVRRRGQRTGAAMPA